MPTRCLHDCRRTAARTLIRASVPERVALRLTGHKSRTIFDRDHIIHEQELLDAAQRVANLARQAQAPRRRAHLTDKPCIGPRTAKPTGGSRRAIPLRRPHPPPRRTNPPTPSRVAPGAGTRMPAPPRTFGPTLGNLSDAYLQDYQVRQCRSRSPAHGRTAHRTCWVRPMC